MKSFTIPRLLSGGVITNYNCTSACRHCLYACSPKRDRAYMDGKTAAFVFERIRSLGCYSVHIGGGEPFLNTEGIEIVLKAAGGAGVSINYVETNSSWVQSEPAAIDLLKSLQRYGLTTLLISISPFHNEFIAFKKVKTLISACYKAGISVFPWIQDFYPDLDSFDDTMPHNPAEYIQKFGEDYIRNIPVQYWIHYGGRALMTYKDIFPLRSIAEITGSSIGCRELADTSHFHVDLNGNYIPGLCSGMSIPVADIGKPFDTSKYPLVCTLYDEGINGLLKIATEKYNFQPQQAYFSKCHLCSDIRKFIVLNKKINSHELQPVEFYSFI